jgi:triacylglycerol lipase
MTHRALLVSSLVIVLGACGGAAPTTGSSPTEQVAPPGSPSPYGPPAAPATTSTPAMTPPKTPPPPPAAKGSGPPYPVVLLHGMGGFDKLNPPIGIEYWNGIVEDLASEGEAQVYVTTASPYDSSENRAAEIQPQLQAILAKTGAAKLNIIGHSQGGMDARVLASPGGLGMGDAIATVTTIATPHRGSGVADAAMGLLQNVPANVIDNVTGALLTLLEQTAYAMQSDPHLRVQLTELTTSYSENTFNTTYLDDPRVEYFSYAGRTNSENGLPDCAEAEFPDDPNLLDPAQPELFPTAAFLQGSTGTVNDGLVTVASARWGHFFGCVPADHLQEIGLLFQGGTNPISKFDHLRFFRMVVARLRAMGF